MKIPYHKYKYTEPMVSLTWHAAKRDGVAMAFFVCQCGRRAPLTENHSIDDVGNVTPSVWCHPDDGGCGFHESGVVLERYVDFNRMVSLLHG